MSNVEAPNINSGDTNNPDLLAEQSGTPNMSDKKPFVVDTNMQVKGDLSVTGTVTATSFVGDGSQLTGITGASTNDSGPQSEIISGESFVRIEEGSVTGSDVGPSEPKQVSVGGNDLWDVEFSMGNDFQVEAGDDIDLEAEDKIYLTAGGKIDLESNDYIELNSEVRMTGDAIAEGTVTATSFVGDGSQLTGITGAPAGAEPLKPRYPDVSPYYYIYVGEPAAKLNGINDLHYDSDETYDFQYDQEFESLAEAFKFVQESNFDSVAWNDWRTSWVKTRIVFVLQNGKVFGHEDNTNSYISLTHIDNHIIFTTQYSVDRDGTIDTSVTGYSYVAYAVNFSYCPHIHMGGDIGWHDIQSNGSNLVRMWAHSYNEDVYVRSLWAIRGSHVYLDGIVSSTIAEENSYCKIFRVEEMPADLKTKVEALGISSHGGDRGVEAEDNSTVVVLNGYNHLNGVLVTNGSKVSITVSGDDMVMGDGSASGYSYNAISVREGSELSLYSYTFNPNDATAMPNLVINTGTLTQPTPEDNKYITVDWSSKFTRALPIDTTNAVGVQSIDGWGLVRPDLPELP